MKKTKIHYSKITINNWINHYKKLLSFENEKGNYVIETFLRYIYSAIALILWAKITETCVPTMYNLMKKVPFIQSLNSIDEIIPATLLTILVHGIFSLSFIRTINHISRTIFTRYDTRCRLRSMNDKIIREYSSFFYIQDCMRSTEHDKEKTISTNGEFLKVSHYLPNGAIREYKIKIGHEEYEKIIKEDCIDFRWIDKEINKLFAKHGFEEIPVPEEQKDEKSSCPKIKKDMRDMDMDRKSAEHCIITGSNTYDKTFLIKKEIQKILLSADNDKVYIFADEAGREKYNDLLPNDENNKISIQSHTELVELLKKYDKEESLEQLNEQGIAWVYIDNGDFLIENEELLKTLRDFWIKGRMRNHTYCLMIQKYALEKCCFSDIAKSSQVHAMYFSKGDMQNIQTVAPCILGEEDGDMAIHAAYCSITSDDRKGVCFINCTYPENDIQILSFLES